MNFSPEIRPIPERLFDDILKYTEILVRNPEMIYNGHVDSQKDLGMCSPYFNYTLNELSIFINLKDSELRVRFGDSVMMIYKASIRQVCKICEYYEDIVNSLHTSIQHNIESLVSEYYEDSRKSDLFEDTIDDVKEVK